MTHMKRNAQRVLSVIIPACLLFGMAAKNVASAQSFDPVKKLKYVLINRDYSQDSFPTSGGRQQVFLDSMQIDGVLQAFTMYEYEIGKDGWKVWMDFDSDRFRVPRLTSVVMRLVVPRNASKQWRAIRDSINAQLTERVCNFKSVDKRSCSWEWIPRAGYVLRLEYEKPPKGIKGDVIVIRLRHE